METHFTCRRATMADAEAIAALAAFMSGTASARSTLPTAGTTRRRCPTCATGGSGKSSRYLSVRPAGAKVLFVESPLAGVHGVHRSPLGCGPVGCPWHKGFGPGVHESIDIPPP